MARVRQLYPNQYQSGQAISGEFENLIRYLNSAEFGNKTLRELLSLLFNTDGDLIAPVEFRRDSSGGIEYRVGAFTDAEKGWLQLATLDELRGEPGVVAGEVGAPIFYGRQSQAPAASQTVFTYSFSSTDDVLVWEDGLLKTPDDDYTLSLTGGAGGLSAVIFNSAPEGRGVARVTLAKIRKSDIVGYRRVDYTTTETQSVFPFEQEDDTQIWVFKNGIMQTEGGSADYTRQADTNTITFNTPQPASTTVSAITVENVSNKVITGLMLEERYTDLATGLILFSKLGIEDDDIQQSKVQNLVPTLAAKGNLSVSVTAPTTPALGDMWVDTSANPMQLKFFNGIAWLSTSPESTLPAFTTNNANQFVGVNGTGTALEYRAIDFSGQIPLTQKGSANGVASLDSNGRLPSSQLPEVLSQQSLFSLTDGAVSASDIIMLRAFRQRLKIEGLAVRLTSGTCNVEIIVNGVVVGPAYAVTSTPNEFALGTVINIDATSASKTIGLRVSNVSAANTLDATLAISNLSV